MSCGAGPSRRVSHAVRRRGTSRPATQTAIRKAGTSATAPTRRGSHAVTRQSVKNSRRPPKKIRTGRRSKASLTASATARKHAQMKARAAAAARTRALRARAAALSRADRRRAYAAAIACVKKARKSAVSPGGNVVWKPAFRGGERRRWGKGRLW